MNTPQRTNHPIRILHIGAGERSRTLYFPVYRELARRGLLTVTAVYTKNADRQSEVQRLGFTVTADWRPTVAQDGIDAVVVVVPPEQMALVVGSLLEFKCPVLHETPLGRPVGKATALIKKIRASGMLVETAEQQVFHPIEQLRQQVIASGHLGAISDADNRHHSWAYHGVGKLRRYFTDSRLVALRSWALPQPDGSKVGFTRLEFSGGRYATMTFGPRSKAWPLKPPMRTMTITGEHGVMTDEQVSLWQGGKAERFPLVATRQGDQLQALTFANSQRTLAQWENPYLGAKFNDDQIGLAHVLERFCAAVTGESKPAYGVENHYLDLLATQAMELSQRLDGLRVTINPTQPKLGYAGSLLAETGLRHWWLLWQNG